MRAFRYYIVIGWLLASACRLALGNSHGSVAAWTTYIVVLVFSVALVVLVGVELACFCLRRLEIRHRGGQILTGDQLKHVLIIGWLLAAAFRIAASGHDVTATTWISLVVLDVMTVALIIDVALLEIRKGANSLGETVLKYSLLMLGLAALMLAFIFPLGVARSVSVWAGFICMVGFVAMVIHRWRSKKKTAVHADGGQ